MPSKKVKRKASFKPVGDKGAFTEKGKGKQPSKNRPEFKEEKFDLQLLGINIDPPLEIFFQALVLNKNAKILRQERLDNAKINRGTIFSILSLQEIYYPTYTKNCNSDLQCIQHLLVSNLVTRKNVMEVYRQLRQLLVPVLYDEDDVQAMSTQMVAYRKALLQHGPWGTEAAQKLKDEKVFALRPDEIIELKSQKADSRLIKLKNTTKVPDVTLYEQVKALKKLVDNKKKDDKWVTATIQLLQVSTGMRFIEAAVLTTVKLSSSDNYDPLLYLEFHGLAKQRRETEDGELDEDEDVVFLPLGLIVKPILWDRYGVTPQYILELLKQLRDVIGTTVGKKIKPTEQIMKLVRNHYLGKTIKHFDKLWEESGIEFTSKTHTWRKLYGQESNQLYNKDGSMNWWLMSVLGHVSILTSLSYANIVIVRFPVVNNKDLATEMSIFQNELDDLKSQIKEQAKAIQSYNNYASIQNSHDSQEHMETNLVSLPAAQKGAENVQVPFLNMPRKRFKPDQKDEKKAYLDEWYEKAEEVLEFVDKTKLRDDDFKRIGITQELLRRIKKR